MNTVVNKFRYTIEDRIGPLIVSPLGESDFLLVWELESEGKQDYKNTLPSAIVFTGEAFGKLLKIEKSIYRCEFCAITIERRCGGTTWTPWFSGRMSNNDGQWDLDRCTVTMKLDDIKPGQCIEDNKTTQVNLFGVSIGERRSIFVNPAGIVLEKIDFSQTVTGEIPCRTLTPWDAPGTPLDGAWVEYKEERTETGSGGGKTCVLNSWYARETILLPCGVLAPGPEWIVVADGCPSTDTKWAREARLYGCTYSQPDFGDTTLASIFECQIVGDAPENITIDNGLPLDKVFELFLDSFCPGYTVVSDFFQINPDVESEINYVTGLRSKTRFITIFQKSDVKRPSATNNATIANMTLGELLDDLVSMFNVRWRVEGNVLRIEHVSFFVRAAGFNLTEPRWARYVVGLRRYTYDSAEIPQKETFTFMEASGGDFEGAPIIYSECVTQNGRENTVNFSAENVTTDVQLCLANPDPDSEIVQDDGFVFIAADLDDSGFFIISEATILGGNVVNNSLAWAQLQRDYYKWDRPARHGLMNYIETVFNTVQPKKRGAPITIPLCCDDVFNPDDTISTALGSGTVDKATFSFKGESLTLELLYAADIGLTTNEPPLAQNDVVATPQDTGILINVIANDTDENNQLLTVKIILPPLHGTAIVIGTKVHYQPALGYQGSDLFLYTVSDEWNQPSNNAMVSIIVTPPNAAPIAVNDAYDGQKNTALNIASPGAGLFRNDLDDIGFILASYDATSANGGTVVVNPDGTFVYTPPTGFIGLDTFDYTIVDSGALSDTATVTINVRDPDAPVANPDEYQTVKNINLNIAAPGVLANDTTSIGVLATVSAIITTAQGGSVAMSTDGSFLYTPPANFVGVDTFTYTADNGTSTDSALVTIRVLPLIWVKMSLINLQTQPNPLTSCPNGSTDGGLSKTETIRVQYFSNAAGTIPIDVTGLGLIVYLRTGIQSAPGGPVSSSDDGHFTSGTQNDLFVNRMYFRQFKDCNGNTVYYTNEVFTLLPGSYTII
jgi:hypothetical protein